MNPETNQENKLQEQFVYPKNRKLRDAYIALLGRVRKEWKICFSIFEAVEAICEKKDWIMDHTSGSQKASGPNFKKATQLLKQLEGKYFRFREGMTIEVIAFNKSTRCRVTNFEDLFDLCDNDRYLSEYSDQNKNLVWDEWEDPHKILSEEDEYRIDKEVAEEILAYSKLSIIKTKDDNQMDSIKGFRQSKEDYMQKLQNSIPLQR